MNARGFDPSRLTALEAETLIRYLMYRIQPEERGKLMDEQPFIYNKLHGRDIMVIERNTQRER